MRKMLPILAVVFAVILVPSLALGASPWTEKSTNKEKVVGKLDYGLKNLLGGWTEIITVPIEYFKEDKNIFAGLGQGMWNSIVYSVGGALHTGTFFIPQIDIPIPDCGVSFE